MRITIPIFLGALYLSGCINGRAEVEGDILNFTAADSKFAFFGVTQCSGADVDGDGAIDSGAVVVVVLTDNSNFCKDRENIAVGRDPALFGDNQQIALTAALLKSNSADPAIEDDQVIINDTANLSLTAVEFSVQQAGEEVAEANDGGDTTVTIQNLRSNTLKADFTSTVIFQDAAGVDQTATISGSFTANRCQALDGDAFVTGAFLGAFL